MFCFTSIHPSGGIWRMQTPFCSCYSTIGLVFLGPIHHPVSLESWPKEKVVSMGRLALGKVVLSYRSIWECREKRDWDSVSDTLIYDTVMHNRHCLMGALLSLRASFTIPFDIWRAMCSFSRMLKLFLLMLFFFFSGCPGHPDLKN